MRSQEKIIALIVAGGSGVRFGGEIPKQYIKLKGREILAHSIAAFAGNLDISGIQVVIGKEHGKFYREAVKNFDLLPLVFGGKTRQASVLQGLKAIAKHKPDKVLIHDAARPFVSQNLISRVIRGLRSAEAVVPVIAAVDTAKLVKSGQVLETLDKSCVAFAQTPQGFHFSTILRAHGDAIGRDFPDDAAAAENDGIRVATIPGEEENFKITTETDMKKAMMEKEARVGSGFDVHAFGPGNHVIICGIKIAHNKGLIGHSDADVGLHAITDALLGAVGAGDIGEHFPPSNKKWKNADSAIFLKHAAELIAEKGRRINNIDVTIIAESPKISPHRGKMRKRIAAILQIPLENISVKATTTEGLGFTGRGEGIAAQAVAIVGG